MTVNRSLENAGDNGAAPTYPRCLWGEVGDCSGLTTLQWLLIGALVAAVAAAATLSVTAAVEDAGESVSANSAQLGAARVVAEEVERDARRASAGDFDTWADWEAHFRRRCALVSTRFDVAPLSDAANRFVRAGDGRRAFDETAARHAAAADRNPPSAAKAQARCTIE